MLKHDAYKQKDMSEEFISKLKDNAIFQMSLTSKELFHSNFLAWLSESVNTRDVFANVLQECFGLTDWNSEEMYVKREHNHFDFSICRKDEKKEQTLFVLENKFKSAAYKEQLNKYFAESEDSRHVLLTLAHDFLEKEEIAKSGWMIVTYQEYIKVLRNAVSDMKECFDKQVIMHYCDFVETFDHAINEELLETENNKKTTWSVLDEYFNEEELRCNDIWQKLFMHQCAQKLSALVKEAFPDKNVKHYDPDTWTKEQEDDIFVRVAYYHSQALVEIRYLLPTGVKFCVQQQGDSPLSVGIAIKNSDIDKSIAKNAKKADKEKWSKALKAKISQYNLDKLMPPNKKNSYYSFQAAGKEGYFYAHVDHNDETIDGTLNQMIELTKEAIKLSHKQE